MSANNNLSPGATREQDSLSENSACSQTTDGIVTDYKVAEYNALRAEILKHMETEYQITTSSLVIFGTILGLGFQNKNAVLVLIYPIIALFLSRRWSFSVLRAEDIGGYIEDKIENQVNRENKDNMEDKEKKKNMWWQHNVDTTHNRQYSSAVGVCQEVCGNSF